MSYRGHYLHYLIIHTNGFTYISGPTGGNIP